MAGDVNWVMPASVALSIMKQLRFGAIIGVVLLSLLVVHEGDAQQQAIGAQSPAPAYSQQPADATVSLSDYSAVGSDMVLANRLEQMGWSEAQITAFVEGIRAALHRKPFPADEGARKLSQQIVERIAAIESKQKQEEFAKPERLSEYLKDTTKRLHLQVSDSGLRYGIKEGTMEVRPGPDDSVVIRCAAFAADGTTPIPQLTSEKSRAKVSDMLPGFVEGIQMMSVGSQAIFVLPPALSFGSGEWPPGVVRGTPLIFRITLLEVIGSGTSR